MVFFLRDIFSIILLFLLSHHLFFFNFNFPSRERIPFSWHVHKGLICVKLILVMYGPLTLGTYHFCHTIAFLSEEQVIQIGISYISYHLLDIFVMPFR